MMEMTDYEIRVLRHIRGDRDGKNPVRHDPRWEETLFDLRNRGFLTFGVMKLTVVASDALKKSENMKAGA